MKIGNLLKIGLGGYIIAVVISTVCWIYSINTWLIFFGKTSHMIVWWQGLILGIIPGFGQLSIVLAIVTWIAMLFLI